MLGQKLRFKSGMMSASWNGFKTYSAKGAALLIEKMTKLWDKIFNW